MSPEIGLFISKLAIRSLSFNCGIPHDSMLEKILFPFLKIWRSGLNTTPLSHPDVFDLKADTKLGMQWIIIFFNKIVFSIG